MDQNKEYKILLIEDEPEIRESYEDMFGFIGLPVDTAENGLDGLAKLEKEHYDIVITDLNMPVMDGMETLRRIKKKDESIEVIVITGFATIENAIKAMKQGAFDYITKPVSFDHVKIVVNKCIQKINARRENLELKNTNVQLKELNELKDKFITITNHELRTPLAVLRGYFDLLELEVAPDGNPEIKEYLDVINYTITEMMEMVENMHDFSSFKNYTTIHDKKKVEINKLVRDVVRAVKILFENRNINLITELSPQEVWAEIDEKMIQKAVRELIQNALKYTEDGGTIRVTVKNIPERKQIFISVQDTGIGIPTEKLNLIFEPFYEVQDVLHHSTSKTDFMGGGIGVGLSLVKETVEAHGGEMAVESKAGEGSTFTIILPCAN